MTFLAIPDTIKFEVTGTFDTATWANIFYAQYTGGPPNLTEMNTISSDFATAYKTRFESVQGPSLDYVLCRASDMNSDTGVVTEAPMTGSGSYSSGDEMAASNAICISWDIASRYRGGHPRTYLCGMATGMAENSRLITNTFQGAVETAAVGLLGDVAAIATGGVDLTGLACVRFTYDVVDGRRKRTGVLGVFPLTGVSVHNRIDSQRRRLGKETF